MQGSRHGSHFLATRPVDLKDATVIFGFCLPRVCVVVYRIFRFFGFCQKTRPMNTTKRQQ